MKLNESKVSVIIPTYNRSRHLVTALDSVFSQTYPPFEVLVVDDGSTDDTPNIIAAYGNRVRYLTQRNKGPSAARNWGIREAQGDFIAFLDSDDAWLPNKLELQIARFTREPSLGLLGTAYYTCDENLNNPVLMLLPPLATSEKEEILIRNIWPTPSLMIRKRCFEMVGDFDEGMRFAEDWDMWTRISMEFQAGTLSEPLVLIRKHQQSLNALVENSSYNFGLWFEVILRNRRRYAMGTINYRKAMSWYYLNQSYHYQVVGDMRKRSCYLLKSIIEWPFFNPNRFLSLIKSFI